MKIPKIWKWLPVVRKKEMKGYRWANASYSKGIITVYDRMINKGDEEIKLILDHEYYHHIYTKLSKIIKIIWKLISNWRLRTILNILMWTDYKKNHYIRDISKGNPNEDFARHLAQWRAEWKWFNYSDTKIYLATNIFKYFSKK